MRIRAFGKIRRRHCGTGGVWFIKIIITTLLIASSIAVQAAPVALKGRVVEATTKEPLQYANVVLLTAGDSAFVAGTVSGEDGAFEIEHVDSGKYILKASFVGYESTFKAIEVSDKPFDAGDIELSEAVALQEVVVTARKAPFEASATGGVIANVSTTLLSSVGTASDVLQRIPGVVVAENGAITVFGKGTPKVYIDNRRLRDLSELSRLESVDISTVELIAEGAAILLIKTRTKISGFAAQVTERLRKGKYFGDNENLSMSFTHDRLNAFATIIHNYSKHLEYSEHNVLTINDENDVRQYETRLPDNLYSGNSELLSGGFDYSLSDRHAFGGQYQLFKENSDEYSRFTATTRFNQSPYTTSEAISDAQTDDYQHLVNAFYNFSLNRNFAFNLYFDYLKNHDTSEQTSIETGSDADTKEIDLYNLTDYDLYALKLTNIWKSDVGTVKLGCEYKVIEGEGSVSSKGYTANSEFNNAEKKLEGFLNYTHKIHTVNILAALSYEYTQEQYTKGADRVPVTDRAFGDWYPSLTLSTAVRDVSLKLSFIKSNKLPSFSQLNGNVSYVNPFVLRQGNPYLDKCNTYEYSFQTVRRPFYLNISYEYQKSPIVAAFSTQAADDGAAAVLSTYNNFPNYKQLSLMLNFNHIIAFWQPNYSAGYVKPFFRSFYNGEELTFDRPYGIFKVYNDFTLPTGFVASCNFQYRTPSMQYYTEIKERKQLDFSLRKSLLNNSLRFNLSVYDVFNWQKEATVQKYNNLSWVTDKKYETRYATFSITYFFNNYRKVYRGENAAQADMERFSFKSDE
jgi:hypothetical protein